MTDWFIGDSPTLTVTFKNEATPPALTDPTDVELVVRKPDASIATVPLVSLGHPSTGMYTYKLPLDQSGTWNGEWRATGALIAVEPFSFSVGASALGPAPVGYTYDPTTPIGKVRLYTDDRDMSSIDATTPIEQRSAVFADAEIQVFLDHNNEDVFLAAAEALITFAGNKSLIVQSRKFGGTSVDYGSIRADLMKQAEELRNQSISQMPYSEFAEVVYDDFGFRRTLNNRIMRESQ